MADRKYVVIARFDDETEHKFIKLQESLIENGYSKAISEWPPHITIAAYESISINELLRWTKEFSSKQSVLGIMLSSLGIFPPGGEHTETAVLFASPTQTKKLIEFYYAFHERLDEYCGKLGWFYSAKFGHPVMHSTIGKFDIKQMQKALEIIFAQPIFGPVKINALEVYTYPMELIQRVELKLEG